MNSTATDENGNTLYAYSKADMDKLNENMIAVKIRLDRQRKVVMAGVVLGYLFLAFIIFTFWYISHYDVYGTTLRWIGKC